MNINEIFENVKRYSNSDVISIAESLEEDFCGIRGSYLLDDVLKSREFVKPSSFYGHRYNKNISAITDFRPGHPFDLFVTDKEGILKNNSNSQDSSYRIKNGKKKDVPIIFIFGGSTIAGMGAQF